MQQVSSLHSELKLNTNDLSDVNLSRLIKQNLPPSICMRVKVDTLDSHLFERGLKKARKIQLIRQEITWWEDIPNIRTEKTEIKISYLINGILNPKYEHQQEYLNALTAAYRQDYDISIIVPFPFDFDDEGQLELKKNFKVEIYPIDCSKVLKKSPSFEWTIREINSPDYLKNLPSDNFEAIFKSFLQYLLKKNTTESRSELKNILNNEFPDGQLIRFTCSLSKQIIFKKDKNQKKIISNFLELINLSGLETVLPRSYKKELLERIKADALIFPISHYQPPKGFQKELITIWKLFTQDIDSYLTAVDILTQRPVSTLEATSFINFYKLSMGVTGDIGPWLNKKITDPQPESISLALLTIPFAANVLRRLYLHYCTKTPSSLYPLLDFSDPNFYENVVPINNREQILTAISSAWDENVTPILIGEPGCGKTSILIEVARRINMGNFLGLQGDEYKAFGGSASSLASADIRKIFNKISEKKHFTVLLLDDIQFNDSQKALLGTYFDGNSPQSIRYALFATTPKGAKAFYKDDDGSLRRRFKNIHVPNLNHDETVFALYHQALSMAPHLNVDPLVIKRIVTHSKGSFSEGQKILFQLIRKVLNGNIICRTQSLYDLTMTQINSMKLYHQFSTLNSDQLSSPTSQTLNDLEQKRIALEKIIKEEKLAIQNHALLLAKRRQLSYKILDISQKILTIFHDYLSKKGIRLNQMNPITELENFESAGFQERIDLYVKKFIYYNTFLKKELYEKIQEFEKLGLVSDITTITDDDLIIEDFA